MNLNFTTSFAKYINMLMKSAIEIQPIKICEHVDKDCAKKGMIRI